jgi:hypothetical protein
MDDIRGSERAHSGNAQPFGAEHQANNAMARARQRQVRWITIATVAAISAGTVWAISQQTAKRITDADIEIASQVQRALPEFPPATPTVDINNRNARLGLVPAPKGTAVAYADVAGQLVSGGKFQTDLPLYELAKRLKLSPDSIEKPRAPGEVDPDAELFRAQAGTLTKNGKELSRKMRKRQLLEGKPLHFVFTEWVVTNYSFTLNRLKHPNIEEKIILSAIARAAAGTIPLPGDTIRAVGVSRGELETDRIALAAGYLPLQTQQQAEEELRARP